jgi:aminopeptidase N
MDKYFSALASSNVCDVDGVKALMEHELFSFNTPNRLRSGTEFITHTISLIEL